MASYTVRCEFDIPDASSPEDAALQADEMSREPGMLPGIVLVTNDETGEAVEVDLMLALSDRPI